MLEQKNDQMSLKIEQSTFSSNPNPKLVDNMTKNMQGSQPGTTMAGAMSHMGGQPKYNSIDIGYDESNFDSALNGKNSKTNTNISSKKKMLQGDALLRASINSTNKNIYQGVNDYRQTNQLKQLN